MFRVIEVWINTWLSGHFILIPEVSSGTKACIIKIGAASIVLLLAPLLILAGCQSQLIYFPRPYSTDTVVQWQKATAGKFIDVTTSQGKQRSFLQGNIQNPRNLWIVCGGNGTVALDWSEWLIQNGPSEDAWLLVDMPGYGDSAGEPTPERIRETFRAVIPAVIRELGWDAKHDSGRMRFFGHSLGSAGCLMAASDFSIQRGVLLAPFTSTMDMAQHITGLPVGFVVWHRMDNDARLTEIETHGPARVVIFHGADDESIPADMSRKLARRHPATVVLHEIPKGRHNTLQENHTQEIAEALRMIGRNPKNPALSESGRALGESW